MNLLPSLETRLGLLAPPAEEEEEEEEAEAEAEAAEEEEAEEEEEEEEEAEEAEEEEEEEAEEEEAEELAEDEPEEAAAEKVAILLALLRASAMRMRWAVAAAPGEVTGLTASLRNQLPLVSCPSSNWSL